MIRFYAVLVVALIYIEPRVVLAQSDTLLDIRQELNVLNVEIQKLRREMSTTGGTSVSNVSGTILDRLNVIESALQSLTSKTEEIEFRIDRIVKDGTNRIGDLEFRLVELEGGDASQLGQTSTLGGNELKLPSQTTTEIEPQMQLAEQESADFERAQAMLLSGDFQFAIENFTTFKETYPGSPLAVEVELRRGQALEGLGDVRESSRAYLSAFSIDPQNPLAAEALYRLGVGLGGLGKTLEACLTLDEVALRYPNSPYVVEANAARLNLDCS
ncbi:MAG: tetratricopeptide repeat protein [Tateyamaria sp.]|jgi:tol-pal system protein YbgF|nr:tetratricopeptide repeat protein [Tateyamaria sp.]MBT5301447.1 tetratricopeptide repeat protein [Tateyamaria sp.]MBT6267855.1 tetratricopeptide repeat protein [Tateyamaria sp.]MBT6344280.1 tetratricopeptide repeat protein [Tateyamaria sp.]MBT7448370.1 tetratricopeptide repeat protein [Tateyamaria sp.]